jgi:hypothetical protein
MAPLEIRIGPELGETGVLGLLAAVDFFPSEQPDEISVLVGAPDAWGGPAIRAVLAAAIATYPSKRTLSVGPLPISEPEGWMDFYAALGEQFKFGGASPRPEPGRFFPLRWVTDAAELDPVSKEIAGVLTDDPDARRFLEYLVDELLENALHHGEWERGALVGAQFFPKSQRAQLVIADCGQGVRRHLSWNPDLSVESDQAALDLALRPWVTGTAGQSRLNRAVYGHVGCGLPMAAGLVTETDGVLLLASGAAGHRIDREGRHGAAIRPWRGTVVVVDVLRPRLRDFAQVSRRVRERFGPRPARRPLRFG